MDEWKQFLQSTEMSLRIMDTIYDERVLTEITSQIRQHIKVVKGADPPPVNHLSKCPDVI